MNARSCACRSLRSVDLFLLVGDYQGDQVLMSLDLKQLDDPMFDQFKVNEAKIVCLLLY